MLTFALAHSQPQKVLGRISYTTDLWSDQGQGSYLALTAHWIARGPADSLELRSGLAAFHWFMGKHSGDRLSLAMLALLDHAGTTQKVQS